MTEERFRELSRSGGEERERLRRMAAEWALDYWEEIPPDCLDPALVERIPVEWARLQGVLPIRWEGRIGVLTADPSRTVVLDDVGRLLKADVTPVVAPLRAITAAIERTYAHGSTRGNLPLGHELASEALPEEELIERGAEDLLQVSRQAPITRLARTLLLEALQAGASDLHLEPAEDRLRVRIRVDGVLYDQAVLPKNQEAALISRFKIMGRMDIAEKRLPQDGMMRVRLGDRKIDVRLSTIPVSDGERMVLRLLDRESSRLPLDALGMPGDIRATFDRLLAEPHGLLICSGPTGSGKTTTLYAALQRLDSRRLNIMTIEDPIEYRLPAISQIQVKPKIGLTFATGLRHILRQDPDVVLVGEMRDLETAEIAVRASLTGHLVFTTLHTNDAPGAVIRLTDMGVPPYLVAAALRGVLAQRLVRCLCPNCRTFSPPREEEKALWSPFQIQPPVQLPRAEGCAQCREGYRGRIGLFELMVVTDAIAGAIRAGEGEAACFRRLAEEAGMRSLRVVGLERVREGITTLDEVIRALGHGGG